MIRISTLSVCVAIFMASTAGCDKAADEQRNADEARALADQKAIEANREATTTINAAQADADKKVADAQANFLKMREDYRHKATESLIEVDKDIAQLEANAKTLKSKAKAELEARLPNLRTQREAVANEYKSLELASSLTWDATKVRVDKAIDDLKGAVSKAD